MFKLCVLLVALIAQDCSTQDEDGPYRGKFIGKLNSYHHQVSGDVYAVDEWTLMLLDFNYDGTGDDTFFWAGDSGRPGPQGFIIPDQRGKTNILERYYNEAVRLTLPEGKRVSRLKWLAVYDIGSQNTFGDVYVPDEFEPPAPRALPALTGRGVSSLPLQLLDANTILIPEFRYDGAGGEVYFWAGVGPQPSAKGFKIPDEYGYLEPLGAYRGADVRLALPGGRTAHDVNWLALWDAAAGRSLAGVLLPAAPNVPPAPGAAHPYTSSLPHCKQLHRDYQVSWEVFGSQITIQLAGQIATDEYMAFGISGANDSSRMLGADVAVATFDTRLQQGKATDYNISATAPCVQVLGRWQGVCRDELVGGLDSNQVFSASRDAGITVVTYRRSLQPAEPMDLEWSTVAPQHVVWALGRAAPDGPAFHDRHPRHPLALQLARPVPDNDCFPFTIRAASAPTAWETAELFDPALRVFTFRLGPAGGARGLAARAGGRPAPALAWYVNGQLAPELQLRRGLHYTFKVLGGNDPHSATEYHPLVVTGEPAGGLERLSAAEQRAARVFAGALLTRRGRLSPTAAGPLCVGRQGADADVRRAADFATFRAFNRSLRWECGAEPPAELAVLPNSSWPDIVYYHSFTHQYMGGRIYVVDRHKRNIGRAPTAGAARPPARPAALLALAAALLLLPLLRP